MRNKNKRSIIQGEIKPVVHKPEFAGALCVSLPTFNRWFHDFKLGLNNLPPPLDIPGRRLAWNRDLVEEYLSQNLQPVDTSKVESAAQRRKRNEAALAHIQKNHGRKVKPKTKEVSHDKHYQH